MKQYPLKKEKRNKIVYISRPVCNEHYSGRRLVHWAQLGRPDNPSWPGMLRRRSMSTSSGNTYLRLSRLQPATQRCRCVVPHDELVLYLALSAFPSECNYKAIYFDSLSHEVPERSVHMVRHASVPPSHRHRRAEPASDSLHRRIRWLNHLVERVLHRFQHGNSSS